MRALEHDDRVLESRSAPDLDDSDERFVMFLRQCQVFVVLCQFRLVYSPSQVLSLDHQLLMCTIAFAELNATDIIGEKNER